MVNKLFFFLLLLMLNTPAWSQNNSELPGLRSAQNGAATLTPEKKKSVIAAANRVYTTFYNIVTNAQNNRISRNLISSFCKESFWEDAYVETINLAQRRTRLAPCEYFKWLYDNYHSATPKFDSTSRISIKLTLEPTLTVEDDGNYKVTYNIIQTTENRRNGQATRGDVTTKTIAIEVRVDTGNHPKIAAVNAIHATRLNN